MIQHPEKHFKYFCHPSQHNSQAREVKSLEFPLYFFSFSFPSFSFIYFYIAYGSLSHRTYILLLTNSYPAPYTYFIFLHLLCWRLSCALMYIYIHIYIIHWNIAHDCVCCFIIWAQSRWRRGKKRSARCYIYIPQKKRHKE